MTDEQKNLVRVIKFFTTVGSVAKRDKGGNPVTDETGNIVLEEKEEHWVTYAPAHSPQSTQTTERVRHLIPSDNIRDSDGERGRFMRARWHSIGPAYEAWKSGNEIPEGGVPLAAWSGVSKSQVEVFKANGIRTVEEVAELAENQIDKISLPGVRATKKLAANFLSTKTQTASDERIAALEAKLEAATDMISEMTSADKSADQEPTLSDIDALRAECDERGIEYHHRHGAPKLRELLAENIEAA